jgi:hypothetical protein
MSHILDGKAIDVKKAVPKSESYSDVVNFDQNFVTNKVFVGGIPLHADENDIKRVFSRYGPILDQTIIRDKFSKQSRGFGFVEFTVRAGLILGHPSCRQDHARLFLDLRARQVGRVQEGAAQTQLPQ